jgi:putative tricarboxylic transport membrane protein
MKKVWMVAAALCALAAGEAAAYKPTRPVEVVVHTGPGGGSDLLARAVATMIEKEQLLPVRMQVVNKTGGGSAVAAAYLAEKKGDQNTIGFFTGVWLTTPLTTDKAKVTLRDLTPIARLVLEPALIAVKADSPYQALKDFIAAAKQKPGELKQATTWCASCCRKRPARGGPSSPSRAAASASRRCSAGTWT